MRRIALAIALAALLPVAAMAQSATSTTGSQACATIVQAAANGMAARISADDTSINPPQSVTTLSCLQNFFSGAGLNVITNLLNPASLLQAVEGQICQAVNTAWQNALGSAECGLTVTGFNMGFGLGLGGGTMCPKLSFRRRRAADRFRQHRLQYPAGFRPVHERRAHRRRPDIQSCRPAASISEGADEPQIASDDGGRDCRSAASCSTRSRPSRTRDDRRGLDRHGDQIPRPRDAAFSTCSNSMNAVENTVSDTMKDINTAIGNTTYGDTNTLLTRGLHAGRPITPKAQIGAQQQITDASNTAMARFQRNIRNSRNP